MAPGPEHILGLAATNVGTDAAAAVPADVYATFVLEALYAERKFEGLVAATTEDLTAEAGDTVKVAALAARTAQGPIAEGTALTDNASSISVVPITLSKYGDYDLVNAEVFEDQKLFDSGDFLRNMGRALAEAIDQTAYDALEGAAAVHTEALATAGVYADLYDKVVDLKKKMEGAKLRPSHLIIHPDQEAQFLKDTSEGIKLTQIDASAGNVSMVAGLSVVVSPLANAQSATLSEVQAIVIDSSRALGEVWGRRPDTTVDDVSRREFDQVKLVTWLRYGNAVLEAAAVGHIKNPAA